MASITDWQRLEPRPRANAFGENFSLPIADPLWFLTRQWQFGDYDGTDAGSIAYVEYQGTISKIPRALIAGEEREVADQPLEPHTLREPFEPDLGLKVEVGQDFLDFLLSEIGDEDAFTVVRNKFLDFAPLEPPVDDELVPVDPATRRFLAVCQGRCMDGIAIYQLGLEIAAGNTTVPPEITTDPAEIAQVEAALATLVAHVRDTFGHIAVADPATWEPMRLEYQAQVIAEDPGGNGNATLNAHPDALGQYDWSSFDVIEKDTGATEPAPEPVAFTTIPTNVRFTGMANPRLWMFEENSLSFVDIEPNKADLVKLLATDFMLLHGNDWYVLPYQPGVDGIAEPRRRPGLGALARTSGIVVVDVFGERTLIERADQGAGTASTDRWTMFSVTDAADGAERLTDYFIVPPSAGPWMQVGAVLEDVRFGRDEMANMAWGIERVTQSPIGEPRSGRERDAEIAARQNLPRPEPLGDAPLRYQVQTDVPANWIPLLGVPEDSADPNNPSIVLEKGAALRPTEAGTLAVVPALGRILSPQGQDPYQIFEEEVPRSGVKLERVVYRTRWHDGTTHLWVERRRQAGAGESQSNLRFDQALPNDD